MDHFKKFGTATISQNNSGQYFVSFIVHRNVDIKQPISDDKISETNSLGFDFGLKHFLTLSDGQIIDSPESFTTGENISPEVFSLSLFLFSPDDSLFG